LHRPLGPDRCKPSRFDLSLICFSTYFNLEEVNAVFARLAED
jgi:hypothetical protein